MTRFKHKASGTILEPVVPFVIEQFQKSEDYEEVIEEVAAEVTTITAETPGVEPAPTVEVPVTPEVPATDNETSTEDEVPATVDVDAIVSGKPNKKK